MIDSLSKLPKSSQCKHQSEANLEGHIVIDGTSEIDALHIALQTLDGYHIVSFPSRDLW